MTYSCEFESGEGGWESVTEFAIIAEDGKVLAWLGLGEGEELMNVAELEQRVTVLEAEVRNLRRDVVESLAEVRGAIIMGSGVKVGEAVGEYRESATPLTDHLREAVQELRDGDTSVFTDDVLDELDEL